MKFDINAPILVFDSGVGGISVLKELVKVMPHEDFIFFGDSKNSPYGTKPTEVVKKLTIDKVSEYLRLGIKGCAIACNTATSAAVADMRVLFPELPLVGIEPAIKPAALNHPGGRILVMATPITIEGQKLHNQIKLYEDIATIIPLACPGLMEFIEGGKIDSPELIDYLKEHLKEYIENPVDAFVTGCTHYPFVADKISSVLGSNVKHYDGANGTARELKRRLNEAKLLKDSGEGHIKFISSDPSPEKIQQCKTLFNRPL
ncbi:MAG: glutamate racemase [Lachnospiraceae bacterium]|nr:glutamate racemase [Lachnospiraceae bacterium]